MIYKNRTDAGRRLARELSRYAAEDPIILALPRGGVTVAAEIAEALDAPLDLIFVRKIGVPYQRELAMGAVVDGGHPHVIRNEDIIAYAGVSEETFQKVCEEELAEIDRRRARYVAGRPRADVRDRTVIVVDDGIATGATTRAALEAVREKRPRKLVLAVPVAPSATLDELKDAADETVCLQAHEPFYAIGLYYEDFEQVSDAEVLKILSMVRAPEPPGAREKAAQPGGVEEDSAGRERDAAQAGPARASRPARTAPRDPPPG
jgi:putative phosphoribosyl transferase